MTKQAISIVWAYRMQDCLGWGQKPKHGSPLGHVQHPVSWPTGPAIKSEKIHKTQTLLFFSQRVWASGVCKGQGNHRVTQNGEKIHLHHVTKNCHLHGYHKTQAILNIRLRGRDLPIITPFQVLFLSTQVAVITGPDTKCFSFDKLNWA